MTTPPTLVITGLSGIIDNVRSLRSYTDVIGVNSVSELLTLVTGAGKAWKAKDVVFVIGDKTIEDNNTNSLAMVVSKLAGASYQVIVVTTTVGGQKLAAGAPLVGIVTVPLNANKLIYAVNSFGYTVKERDSIENIVLIDVSGSSTIVVPQTKVQEVRRDTPVAERISVIDTPKENTPDSAFPGKWGVPGNTSEPIVVLDSEKPKLKAVGWYTDPSNSSQERLWDGSEWTDSSRVRASSAPAQPSAPPAHFASVAPTAAQSSISKRPSLFNTASTTTNPEPTNSGPVQRAGAYRSLPANHERRGYVITTAVSKGGTGKSSLTLNLAAYMGMRMSVTGKTVCVIDANFQQADAGKYLSVYTPNIYTISNNKALLTKENILEGLAHKPEYNMSVLLGPATPDEGNPLTITPELYCEILELLKHHYDYIFIDTPVAEKYHPLFEQFALPCADYIVVPVTPNVTALHDADMWLASAVVSDPRTRRGGIDVSKIGIVLNRAEDNVGCDELEVQKSMARWNYLGAIPETSEWKLANNKNELVVTKQYANINNALAAILYRATGEPSLIAITEEHVRESLLRRLMRRR